MYVGMDRRATGPRVRWPRLAAPSASRPWVSGRLARRFHGGRITPRDHGDTIPVMLSPGMPVEKIADHYREALGLRTNERKEN